MRFLRILCYLSNTLGLIPDLPLSFLTQPNQSFNSLSHAALMVIG